MCFLFLPEEENLTGKDLRLLRKGSPYRETPNKGKRSPKRSQILLPCLAGKKKKNKNKNKKKRHPISTFQQGFWIKGKSLKPFSLFAHFTGKPQTQMSNKPIDSTLVICSSWRGLWQHSLSPCYLALDLQGSCSGSFQYVVEEDVSLQAARSKWFVLRDSAKWNMEVSISHHEQINTWVPGSSSQLASSDNIHKEIVFILR